MGKNGKIIAGQRERTSAARENTTHVTAVSMGLCPNMLRCDWIIQTHVPLQLIQYVLGIYRPIGMKQMTAVLFNENHHINLMTLLLPKTGRSS